MLRPLTLGALVAAATIAVAPAHADPQCITVDGTPYACADALVELNPDTSNGATVAPRAYVCGNTEFPATRPCLRGGVSFGPTGIYVNGAYVGTTTVGGQHVHVPQICRNDDPCVGPYDYDVPLQTIPCVYGGQPSVVANGTVTDPGVVINGTC